MLSPCGLQAEIAVRFLHAVELQLGLDVSVILHFDDGHLPFAHVLVVAFPGVPGVESGGWLAVHDLRVRVEFVPGRPVRPVLQFVDLSINGHCRTPMATERSILREPGIRKPITTAAKTSTSKTRRMRFTIFMFSGLKVGTK